MMKLEELRPTPREDEATADMPEQVAIGWIRAKRRADMARNLPKQPFNFVPRFGGDGPW